VGRAKNIFKDWKIIILLICLMFSFITIKPQFGGNEGVTIRSVSENSSAALAGIINPSPKLTPLAKEMVVSVDGKSIVNVDDYYAALNRLEENKTFRIETNKRTYSVLPRFNELGVDLGMKVYNAPTSNLKKGLDLEGGTRVVLKPVKKISREDLELTINNLKERLNVFGLSDIVIRAASDLAGDDFIVIEIAGVTEEEVKELLASQGKFEAKIGNETVFFGGKKDITYVCRSADCSGIDPSYGCQATEAGESCRFFFAITLSPQAAQRQADITQGLTVVRDQGGSYLSEPLALYLDDVEVDSLNIGAELKGRATTEIQISGGGVGRTEQEAMSTSLTNMKRLQTIIITGSLPVKLDIVKMDTISPTLGKEFLDNILLVGFLAILSVIFVVTLRYRKIKVVVPMVSILLSEMVLILGFAALVGWNLDLAAIAGIIIVAGTGVDHLIVITDEALSGERVTDWKKRIKAAMFIVIGAYLTTCAGMIPLWFAGAGLLKGFAFTTIVGISFGVFIARPAYAAIIKHLLD
jgi:preprotein translocase subunit SecD